MSVLSDVRKDVADAIKAIDSDWDVEEVIAAPVAEHQDVVGRKIFVFVMQLRTQMISRGCKTTTAIVGVVLVDHLQRPSEDYPVGSHKFTEAEIDDTIAEAITIAMIGKRHGATNGLVTDIDRPVAVDLGSWGNNMYATHLELTVEL